MAMDEVPIYVMGIYPRKVPSDINKFVLSQGRAELNVL